MKALIQPTTILLLFICIRAGDLAIGAAIARDVLRSVAYGIISILALVCIIVTLLG